MALTRRQKDFMDTVSRFIERNGYSPSYEELAREMNLRSLATVNKYVVTLRAKGYLRKGIGRSRSIEVVPQHDSALAEALQRIANLEKFVDVLLGRLSTGE